MSACEDLGRSGQWYGQSCGTSRKSSTTMNTQVLLVGHNYDSHTHRSEFLFYQPDRCSCLGVHSNSHKDYPPDKWGP